MKNILILALLLTTTALSAQCPTVYSEPTPEAVVAAECTTWEVSGLEESKAAPVTFWLHRTPDSLVIRTEITGVKRSLFRRAYSPEIVTEAVFMFNGWTQTIKQ